MANTLINNVVLGQTIGAKLPQMLRFSAIAEVDTTLEGVAGDTIKVDTYGYIGEATDVAEGAVIPLSDLSMTSKSVTLKKAGKGVKLTDEEVQRKGTGVVNEVEKQISMSLKDKIDSDCYNVLKASPLKVKLTTKLDFAGIIKGKALFKMEEDEALAIYINPDQEADIMLTTGFIPATNFGDGVLLNGAIGRLAGADVLKSNKVKKVGTEYNNILAKAGALGIKAGRTVGIEEDRKPNTKSTEWYGDEVYVAYIKDDTCVCTIKTTEPA